MRQFPTNVRETNVREACYKQTDWPAMEMQKGTLAMRGPVGLSEAGEFLVCIPLGCLGVCFDVV